MSPCTSYPPSQREPSGASPVSILTASISWSISVSHQAADPLQRAIMLSVQLGDGAEPTDGRGSETIIERISYFQKLRSLTLTDPW